MKFRVITAVATAGIPNVFVFEAEEYNYDCDGLNLTDENGDNVTSFAARHWVAIEKLPENEAVDFARDR